MPQVFADANFNFLGAPARRFFIATGVFILAGLAGLGVRGANESIEFTGGTLILIQARDSSITIGRLREALSAGGIQGAEITTFGGERTFQIRGRVESSADQDGDPDAAVQAARRAVEQTLTTTFGEGSFEVDRAEAITARVGREFRLRALLAVLLSFGAILIYLTFRFEWRFGIAAVGATAWDILLTIGFIGLLHLELSLQTIAAVLTIVGYSINDKIVVFDRVRENLHKYKRENFTGILNRSNNETLPRTVLTGGSVIVALLTLLLLGGPVIRDFSAIMAFGVVLGTFSSIFVGPTILLAVERKWPGEDVRGAKALAAPAPDTTTP
jgi:preprotein translocase subunit SecF